MRQRTPSPQQEPPAPTRRAPAAQSAPQSSPQSSTRPAARDRNADALARQAVAMLEEDIVLGYIHPRERLVEDDLLARFGLKRHVVRQALAELERMGLVERRKNVGALVKSFTVKEIDDLYAVREILETSCILQIALPVPAADLDELEAIQARHDAAVDAADPRAAFRTNVAFHQALFRLCGNPALQTAIDDFAQRTHGIRSVSITHPPYLEQARRQHRDMLDALREGDRDRLMHLVRVHLHPSRDLYMQREEQRTRDRAADRRS